MTRWAVGLLLLGALGGCGSTTNSDWQQANLAGTVGAYQQFLDHHPGAAQEDEARSRILALQDQQAWTEALSTNTAESYQQYLQKEPSGSHVRDAHEHIVALANAAA
jgi:hypothetical protein